LFIRLLGSPTNINRALAARALAKYAPDVAAGAIRALFARLEDPSKDVRLAVAEALGRIDPGQPDAVASLVEILADSNSFKREAAAQALGRIGRPAAPAIPALRACHGDESDFVRKAVFRALEAIVPDKGTPKRTALAEALRSWRASRAPGSFEPILGLIVSHDPEYDLVARVLVRMPSRFKMLASDALCIALKAPGLAIDRGDALALLLCRLGFARHTTGWIRNAIASGKVRRGQFAKQCLDSFGPEDRSAVIVLTEMFERYADYRFIIVGAFASIGRAAEAALPLLERILADTQYKPFVKAFTASAALRMRPDDPDFAGELLEKYLLPFLGHGELTEGLVVATRPAEPWKDQLDVVLMLGSLGSSGSKAIPALEYASVMNWSADVRRAATRSLAKLRRKSPSPCRVDPPSQL